MNEILPVYHGLPWSPYFTFLRDYNGTDFDLLAELDCDDYEEVHDVGETRHISIATESNWTHIADNYRYSHWHSGQIKSAVERLARSHEIFSFSTGDIDYSYEFQYYQGGSLRRSVVWEDPQIDGGRLKQEYGNRLEHEAINPVYDSCSYIYELWSLAQSLGIETEYSKLQFRAYGNTNTESEQKSRGWLQSIAARCRTSRRS